VGAREDPIPRLSQAPRQVVTATENFRYRLAGIGDRPDSGTGTAVGDAINRANSSMQQCHVCTRADVRLAGMRPHRAACDAGVVLRCLIIDDNPRFLDAARVLLEREGITVVGVASSAAEALQRAEQLRPDVMLVDIHLGDQSGFDLVRRLHGRAGLAGSRMVIVSTHAEEDYADLITASPAIGFLPKTTLSARAIRDLLGLSE
jgi:CheY-like chemotaxis protein